MNHLKIYHLKITSMYHLTVPRSQKAGSRLAGELWLRGSTEVSVRLVCWSCCHLRAGVGLEGSTSKLTQEAVDKRPPHAGPLHRAA